MKVRVATGGESGREVPSSCRQQAADYPEFVSRDDSSEINKTNAIISEKKQTGRECNYKWDGKAGVVKAREEVSVFRYIFL
jgi:hypothetical protein